MLAAMRINYRRLASAVSDVGTGALCYRFDRVLFPAANGAKWWIRVFE